MIGPKAQIDSQKQEAKVIEDDVDDIESESKVPESPVKEKNKDSLKAQMKHIDYNALLELFDEKEDMTCSICLD